ncbi:Alpha/Beta hydrolase protein [Bisporella sp. PMI_857]|nr:Alpha/Beta hydrolase protein [Bisporella sp. PMI_857]
MSEAKSTRSFNPQGTLILGLPPPLEPAWLAHERTLDLNPSPVTNHKTRQEAYAKACRDRNAQLLADRDAYLNEGLYIRDIFVPEKVALQEEEHLIPVRVYESGLATASHQFPNRGKAEEEDLVVYYHGGGLYVGDLDSEDLTCRRICKQLDCVVYSVNYRLMTDFTADDAFSDAMAAFLAITGLKRARRLIVMGSSSGGQLAAMVSQEYRTRFFQISEGVQTPKIDGVLLRGPVTCDATDDGANLPARFRYYHTSMSPGFHTSLLSSAAVNATNRVTGAMPLEGDLHGLPAHWIQVCTNDIYYSDGVLYGEALKQEGVEVKFDIVQGYPHTFWLKAPTLERAVKAEQDMIEGLSWLLNARSRNCRPQQQGFMETMIRE